MSSSGSSATASSGGRTASLLTLFTQLSFAFTAVSLLCSAETGNDRQKGYLSLRQSIPFSLAPISKGSDLNLGPCEYQDDRQLGLPPPQTISGRDLTCHGEPLLSHGCSDDIGAMDSVPVPFGFSFVKPLAAHIL